MSIHCEDAARAPCPAVHAGSKTVSIGDSYPFRDSRFLSQCQSLHYGRGRAITLMINATSKIRPTT